MKNLDKLILAAERMVERGVEIDMECYRDNVQDNITHPCGTAGCFLGWAPFMGVDGLDLIESDVSKIKEVNWHRYCHRAFGLDCSDSAWYFLFDVDWPNCAKQCLARAVYLRDNGLPDVIDFSVRY